MRKATTEWKKYLKGIGGDNHECDIKPKYPKYRMQLGN